jgi:hypothetical protein
VEKKEKTWEKKREKKVKEKTVFLSDFQDLEVLRKEIKK